MFFFYRFLALLLVIATSAFLLFVFYKDDYLYFGFFACIIITFAGTYLLLIKNKNWRQNASHSFFSILLIASGIFYLLFVEEFLLKIGIIVLINLLFYLYLNELIKKFYSAPEDARQKSGLSLLLFEAVIVFFMSSGLFGLRDFLSISFFPLILPFALLILILVIYIFAGREKLGLNKIFFFLIPVLVMAELFWALGIFSLVYYLKGLIISLIYLLVMEFILSGLQGQGFNKVIRNYLIIIILILSAVLLTTRWY